MFLNYNSKGQFKGIATVIFGSSKSASLAVEKYNGASIDGGLSKLKLELIVDPSRKPLSFRISPNDISNNKRTDTFNKKKITKNGAKKSNTRKIKKTVEELDQEMDDYFEN